MANSPPVDPGELVDAETGNPVDGVPLGHLLTIQAELVPDKPALTFAGHTLTYARLDSLANRRSRQLAKRGVTDDSRVVVALPNSVEFVECAFAIWKLGATVCPVSERLTADEFAAIVGLLEPALLIVAGADDEWKYPVLQVSGPPPTDLPDDPVPAKAASNARILTSGGSTGRPKLIVDPGPAGWERSKAGYRRPPDSVVLVASPLYHSGPFSTALYALAQGAHVVLHKSFNPLDWLAAIREHRVDYIYSVPTIMTRIAKLDPAITARADFSSLRTLLHMAAPCPHDTKRWWIDRIGADKVLELYGGAERMGLTLIEGGEWLKHPGSVGKPISGGEVFIVGEDGNELPPGEIGEVRFRSPSGPGMTYSYIGAESRIEGQSDSYGDMGWLDEDGYLYIADRRTDMVLLGGVNIYPAEIEAAIESLPGILGSAVIGLPDPDMGNRLHAIIELAKDVTPPNETELMARLRDRLNGLKCPRSFEFTYEPIRDDAGKVRRSSLREARIDA